MVNGLTGNGSGKRSSGRGIVLGKPSNHKLERSTNRSPDNVLTQDQQERRDRFVQRALAKLDENDIPGFWNYLEAANFYIRKVKK